jgi:3-oxoacyl-[acyl-carrier-protein] synthase III
VVVTAKFPQISSAAPSNAILAGSGSAVGARILPSEEVDHAFGMPSGKLRKRAGIESLAYAAEGEDEIALGARAAEQALERGSCASQRLDFLIAAGETFRGYPSLAAQLHSRLEARESCGALDVGGACLGLLNALSIGQALIASGQAQTILIVTADVHSAILTPQTVPGEFGGLFGDGASAFLMRSAASSDYAGAYRLGEFRFGCAGQYASAVRIADLGAKQLDVHFDGSAISRAAITRLERVICDIELRSNLPRASLLGLATHQPNPRLVALLAQQCSVPEEKFPAIARKYGNLGSSTCGLALDQILHSADAQPPEHKPIFLASLGPGLLFGGSWLE